MKLGGASTALANQQPLELEAKIKENSSLESFERVSWGGDVTCDVASRRVEC